VFATGLLHNGGIPEMGPTLEEENGQVIGCEKVSGHFARSAENKSRGVCPKLWCESWRLAQDDGALRNNS